MKINTDDLLNSILQSLDNVDYIKPDEIPNIDLYMDQVTTFMDEHLASTKRYDEDKILTKTMINNYSKNNLLPPSTKKKYSRDHVLLLILIYYFKNILSIKDIETLLAPVRETYFSGSQRLTLSQIYSEICDMEKSRIESLKSSIKEAYEKSGESFLHVPDGTDREQLQLFTFLCSLSFDVYLRKSMIEKIIDELDRQDSASK